MRRLSFRPQRSTGGVPAELPLPPEHMRRLVGPTDPAAFDNPSGDLVFGDIEPALYESVLDFGCGCGRVARQLIQQRERPRRYVGVDIHAGMIKWCRANLAPRADGFEFVHHDVFAAGLNPGKGKPLTRPLPAADESTTLMIAISVFTHLLEEQAVHYLREARRVLRPGGVLNSTFFLFDKSDFPMMQDFQNALYINHIDPTNAVIFDRAWLRRTAREEGLVVTAASRPEVRGFHWRLVLTREGPGVEEVELPEDATETGIRRPPLLPANAELIGVADEDVADGP